MAKQKKPVHRVEMTEGKRNIIRQLLEEYDIETAEDIQDALKDLLGGTIKEMMEAEMDDHLGYEKSQRSDNDDYRNGYKRKQVNSRYGSMEIEVPQDRKSTFEPQVVKKRQKDISDIDQKIISMYAKGMTTRQISETIEDIYGFETSESFISDVTDKILLQIEDWQNRPLDEVYPILYIDAIHYSVRDNGVIRKLAAYVILGINAEGKKEVLTITIGDNESAKYWLSVLNELKNRGVKDILIICADGLTGIKEAISAAFPKTERDIVRLVSENLAVRTHGGITLNDVHQIGNYQTRKQENEEIKNEIGKIAVSLIENNKVIFFDTSTTVAALCQYVESDIEAYSHSLDNIEILSNHCLCQMIGGTYFKKNRYMYGSQTLNMIDQIYFDLAYVAAAAVMEDGIYVEEFEDAMIKKKVASRSQKVCLVVDHSKFNKKSSYKALAFQDIDVLVVDWLPDTYREKIEKAECQIIYTKEK